MQPAPATLLILLVGLSALAYSATIPPRPTSNFLLVTTTSRSFFTNYTHAPHVSATSLFDPLHQEDFYLRLIGPGYGSLPKFNITEGSLTTEAEQFAGQEEQYQSVKVKEGDELVFRPARGGGELGLTEGYLLSVGGECEGWTVCDGTLEEKVVFWKGTDSSCVPRYVHAVNYAPY